MALHGSRCRRSLLRNCVHFVIPSFLFLSVRAQNWGNPYSQNGLPSQDMSNQNFQPQAQPFQSQNFQADPRMYQQPDSSSNFVSNQMGNSDPNAGQFNPMQQQQQTPFADSRQLQQPNQFANPGDQFNGQPQMGGMGGQFGGQSQFGNPAGQFDMGAQGMNSQFGGAPGMNSQFGGNPAGRFAGIPDAQQGAMPQLPSNLPMPSAPNVQFNAPNLPNFKEPEFNFAGLEKMGGMGGGDFGGGSGGFGGGDNGFGGGHEQNGPVGPGQMAVPGLPANNPLQQLAFGSQLDDRLSGAPLDSSNLNQNQPSLFLGLQQAPKQTVAQFDSNAQQLNQNNQRSRNNHRNQNRGNNGWVGFENPQPTTTTTKTTTEAPAESTTEQGNVVSQSQQSRSPTGQEIIATVVEVPLEMDRKQREQKTTEAPVEATEVVPGDGGPTCGFHGLEKWQKSPCETCTCHKGVTNCEKVKCTEKPDGPNCIPIYHFTTCCPTFQCSNSSRGQLPTLETSVQEGDDCTDVGEFVPVSVKNPCLACKCNAKQKIQCKTITCPKRPSDPTCKARVPQNPTVCCPEYDCDESQQHKKRLGNQGGKANASPEDSDSDNSENVDDTSTDSVAQIGHASTTTSTTANPLTTTEAQEPISTTEEAIVIKLEEVTTTTKRLRPFRTTARTTTSTTTEEPDTTTEQAGDTSSFGRPAGAALHTDEESVLSGQNIQSRQFGFGGASTTANTQASTTTTTTTTQSSTTAASARVPSADKPVSEKGLVRDCQGGWKFPAGCDVNKDCSYIARWKQNPMDQTVRFKITTREPDNWTGIGFTTRKNFENVDMVTGWVDKNQKIIIQDRHGNAHQPLLDTQQSISNLRGVRSGGSATIEFSRRQRNGDLNDVSTDDTSCPYFVFPVRAGSYDTFTMAIQAHVGDPEISDVGVCISQCKGKNVSNSVPFTTTSRSTVSTPATTAADSDYDQSDESTPAPARKAAAVSGNTGGQCASEGAVMALNPCQNCTCLQGQIHCTNIKCPDSWTQHLGCQPLYKVGVCCPTWQCPTTTTHQPLQIATRRTIPGAFPTGRPEAVIVTIEQLNALSPPAQQPNAINVTIEVPKNPDKLLLLSKKEFINPVGSDTPDDVNSELEQAAVVPDRMGIVTPPKGWTEPASATTTTQSILILTDQGVQVQTDGCLNFACGTNATCVVSADNSPSCVCRPGYEGNARLACVKSGQKMTSLCTGVKCGKNAQCFNIAGQPQCKCQSGFDGDASISCDVQRISGFVQPPECILRSEIGSCQNFGMRWQYDTRITGCRQFVYSGCAGNDNNFESRQQCEQRCLPQRRLLKDIQCSPDDDIDNPACSRCECSEQGVVACVPISCNAAPNRDCKPLWKDGECCPHYDCSQGLRNGSAEADDSTRSGTCSGVTCREPQFKPGCTRVTLPGDCCPTVQCAGASVTVSTLPQQPSLEVTDITTQATSAVRVARPGVPCSLEDKIASSSPCLSCQCITGITMCSPVTCSPITPDQRRRCRITQLPNQCCLSVECPDQNQALPATSSALRPTHKSLAELTTQATAEQTETATTSTKASTTTSTTSTTTRRPSTTLSTTTRAAAPVGRVGCSEKSDLGICHAEITRWFMNPATKKCETFVYSGCGGNKNRYLTEERCKAACK